MEQINGLDFQIQEMASRIRALREIEGMSAAEMAQKTGVTEEEYLRCEDGKSDLNFAFLYRCALALGVDVTDIIEGSSPTLKSYTLTRAGKGQKVANAHGMTYYNLAYAFRNRIADPLLVRSVYDESAQQRDIELTTHKGQELDIVLEGSLMVQVGEHKETLEAGDSIYYNSDSPHGMIAVGGKDCLFYAIVLNPSGEPIPELAATKAIADTHPAEKDTRPRIYRNSSTLWRMNTARRRPSPSRTQSGSTSRLISWTRWRHASRTAWPCCISPATKPSVASRSAT